MKQYYTLVQPTIFRTDPLEDILKEHGIQYTQIIDLVDDTSPYKVIYSLNECLIFEYIILVEEYELSALTLRADEIKIVPNSPRINRKNKIRKIFSWFFK